MPSSPKITKDMILETALHMLIRDGYDSINIKNVAKEIGCSTQPISWHFGNMDGFRTALAEKAGQYVKGKLWVYGEKGSDDLEKWGINYLSIAMDEPNLFRFTCMGGSGRHEKSGMSSWLDYEQNVGILEQLIQKYKITREQAGQYVQTMFIYIHGMACMVASGIVIENREKIYGMLRETGNSILKAI